MLHRSSDGIDLNSRLRNALEQHPLGLGPDNLPRWVFRALWSRVPAATRLRVAAIWVNAFVVGGRPRAKQIAAVQCHPIFYTDQKTSEISRLLDIVSEERPRYVCEIGAASGGTM